MALPNPNPPFVVPVPEVGTGTAVLPFAALARVDATGDVEIPPRIATGDEAVRLRLLTRYQFFLAEWFLDLRQGMPYFQAVFVKNPDLGLVQSIFRQATLSMPGVQSIIRLTTTLDRGLRELTIDPLEIVLTGGEVFRAQPDEFIITLPGI